MIKRLIHYFFHIIPRAISARADMKTVM